jgi:predicted membrane protein
MPFACKPSNAVTVCNERMATAGDLNVTNKQWPLSNGKIAQTRKLHPPDSRKIKVALQATTKDITLKFSCEISAA